MFQGTKRWIFRWNTLFQVNCFRLRPKWKNWDLCFWREVGCNIRECQTIALLGIPLMWGLQNDRMASSKRCIFERNIFYFDPGGTRLLRVEYYSKIEKTQIFTSKIKFFNRFINFQLFSIILGMSIVFSQLLEKFSEITICHFLHRKQMFLRKKRPIYQETLDFVEKKLLSLLK